jgi:hypothetical protein
VGRVLTAMASLSDSQEDMRRLLGFARTLNTVEANYLSEHCRYADREEILAYLEQQGYSKQMLSAKWPNKYDLAITTSHDGQRFQLTLQPTSDPNDQNAICGKAVFSDEKGLIFVGVALGCEGAPE